MEFVKIHQYMAFSYRPRPYSANVYVCSISVSIHFRSQTPKSKKAEDLSLPDAADRPIKKVINLCRGDIAYPKPHLYL